jgi:hypothetical protein
MFIPFVSFLFTFSCVFRVFFSYLLSSGYEVKENSVAQADLFNFRYGPHISRGSLWKEIATEQSGSVGNAPDF